MSFFNLSNSPILNAIKTAITPAPIVTVRPVRTVSIPTTTPTVPTLVTATIPVPIYTPVAINIPTSICNKVTIADIKQISPDADVTTSTKEDFYVNPTTRLFEKIEVIDSISITPTTIEESIAINKYIGSKLASQNEAIKALQKIHHESPESL